MEIIFIRLIVYNPEKIFFSSSYWYQRYFFLTFCGKVKERNKLTINQTRYPNLFHYFTIHETFLCGLDCSSLFLICSVQNRKLRREENRSLQYMCTGFIQNFLKSLHWCVWTWPIPFNPRELSTKIYCNVFFLSREYILALETIQHR